MGSQSVRHSCVPEHKIKPEELYNNIIIYTNISVHMRLERVETLHEACKPKVWRAGTIAGTGARAHSKQSRRSSCPFGACFLEGGRQHRLRGDGKSLLFFGLGLLEERTPPGKLSKMRRRRWKGSGRRTGSLGRPLQGAQRVRTGKQGNNETEARTGFCGVFWWHWVAWRTLVPGPGIELVPPAVEMQSPNHWTTREAARPGFWTW